MRAPCLLLLLAAAPLSAQAWDIRAEVPFPSGQNLPQTMLSGTSQLVSGDLDKGHGAIFSLSHRIIRVGPVLKLDWGAEFSQLKTGGSIAQGTTNQNTTIQDSSLKQTGVGIGVNAQFWIPFTGVAGEMGVIQRFQHYSYEGAGASKTSNLSRTWMRVGARWRFPMPLVAPYVAASYQQPITKDKPVHVSTASDLAAYMNAQGSGQEFERMWTFGVGVEF